MKINRMVSKRNFFSIAIMMFVLLFLFQFSMVLRDRQNTYDVNSNLAQQSRKMEKMSGKTNRFDPATVENNGQKLCTFCRRCVIRYGYRL